MCVCVQACVGVFMSVCFVVRAPSYSSSCVCGGFIDGDGGLQFACEGLTNFSRLLCMYVTVACMYVYVCTGGQRHAALRQ